MGKRAVFIDRDGVIVLERHLLSREEDLEIIPRADEAIALLKSNNYQVVVVSNQPVVARGLCSEEDVSRINNRLNEMLSSNGARVDCFYICPHHPTEGDNPKYTRECDCRKPKPGMLLRAQKELLIKNMSECFMIGDRISDIKAGKSAGCRTILVRTGYGGNEEYNDAVPDNISENLYEAVTGVILR